MKKRLLSISLYLAALLLLAAQCAPIPVETTTNVTKNQSEAAGSPRIVISAPIIQLSMPNSAAYFELTNEGGTDDALIRVETDMAETADLHETKFDANDVAQMTPLTEVEIPAGGAAALEPGGKHLMLTGLADTVKAGDKMTLILHFQHAEPQTIEAVVQAGPAMAHGDDDHAAQAAEEQAHEHDEAATAAETHELEPGTAAQRFQAAITTYLMDTAGFHAMDDRLNLEGLIDPADAGVVQRVNGLLAATTWPADLSESAHDLTTVLEQYAQALADDDLEAAKPLAAQAHEVQHDFSHAVSHWLEGNQPPTDEEGTVFDAVLVTYLMDTAGFHAMDERLNNDGVIDPADAGVVQRVNGLLTATTWPADLSESAHNLTTVLDQYAQALADDDLEAAKPLAAQAHEVQHDFSHAVSHWLENHGSDHVVPIDESTQRFQVTTTSYLMDTAGFHAMDERLNNEGLIDPADAGVVQRVRGLVGVTAWPAELAEAATSFTTVLDQYAEALAADTVETATPLAAQVHEIQHDLSHNTGSWLSGGHGHD